MQRSGCFRDLNMKSFKITSKTRIKLVWTDICKIQRDYFPSLGVYEAFASLRNDAGLIITSKKHLRRKGFTYFFRVDDKQKYMLAKIKYGI